MADHELPINMNPAELKTHSKLQLRSHSSTLEALPRIEHYDSNETTTKRPSIEDLHAEAQATNFEMADHELPINMKPAELQTHSNLQLRSHSWTLEALPRIENYENIEAATKRPSIEDLHAETHATNTEEKTTQPDQSTIIKGVKLGWIEGVLIPCLLSIWDVMLFLRLSWIVAQAGILQSILIIITASLVCVLTTLSMSAICTNGEVKGGGIYYMISRCLGPEFGTSVGIIFILANVATASMCTIGFCDSFLDLLGNFGLKIIDGGISDIRIVGFISLLIMIIICAMGMEWESKAQDFLLVIILAAIFDFFIGTIIGPQNEEAKAKGFIGFNMDVLKQNWHEDYRYFDNQQQHIFTVFAIFFPSTTGIQAGANISGDLKDPAKAIPKGTLLSILISMTSYVMIVVFLGGAALRGATGNITQLHDGTFKNCNLELGEECNYGLHYSFSVMQLMSAWDKFIYAGCFAATLSTALTNLLSVPRLIQAIGIDRIYPGFMFFSKGYGRHGEPYRGYVLTFIFSAAFVMIADINAIAPLVTTSYLATYTFINFSTFHAAFVKPLKWRPTFKFYNKWLSLFTSFFCIAIMLLINWKTSIITFGVIFIVYLGVILRNPNINWGSSMQVQTYKRALITMQKLSLQSDNVNSYQPQLLVLVGEPWARPQLVDLANLITGKDSLLVCADMVQDCLSFQQRATLTEQGQTWLASRQVKGFFSVTDGYKLEVAARGLMQWTGLGKLKPNVLMMGYKNDWRTSNAEDLQTYFNILHEAFDNHVAVTILRLAEGLDHSNIELNENSILSYILSNVLTKTSLSIPALQLAKPNMIEPLKENNSTKLINKEKIVSEMFCLHNQEISKAVLDNMVIFSKKQKAAIIDVWWLYDDGGLTILLPYILSMRSSWSDCKMRIFALENSTNERRNENEMENLLAKARIKYSSLTMINISEPPKQETINLFQNLISGFRQTTRSTAECVITDAEYESLQDETYRHLSLSEQLVLHSQRSTLVVLSLPIPRKGMVSAPLYMAWLEILTKDMPPFLLVRGNQSSVFGFHS